MILSFVATVCRNADEKPYTVICHGKILLICLYFRQINGL